MTCLLTATQRQYDPDILFWLEIVEAPDEPRNKEKKFKYCEKTPEISKIWDNFSNFCGLLRISELLYDYFKNS